MELVAKRGWDSTPRSKYDIHDCLVLFVVSTICGEGVEGELWSWSVDLGARESRPDVLNFGKVLITRLAGRTLLTIKCCYVALLCNKNDKHYKTIYVRVPFILQISRAKQNRKIRGCEYHYYTNFN